MEAALALLKANSVLFLPPGNQAQGKGFTYKLLPKDGIPEGPAGMRKHGAGAAHLSADGSRLEALSSAAAAHAG